MNPTLKRLIASKKPDIIPSNIKPNVLAWWDAEKRKDVVYGLNQLVANGDFADGLTGWAASYSANAITEGVLLNTCDGSSAQGYTYRSIAFITTHKYYLQAKIQVTNALCTQIVIGTNITAGVGIQLNPLINTPYIISGVTTITSDSALRIRHYYPDTATANGKVMEIQTILAYDLTAILGAGNEPTAAEMDAILAADGTAYWEGPRNVVCNPNGKSYWYDYSGHGRHMKLNNFAYTGASGWQNNPASLGTDGVDDYGIFQQTNIISAASPFSIMCCTAPSATGAIEAVLHGYEADATNRAFMLFYDGGYTARVYDNSSPDAVYKDAINVKSNKENAYDIIILSYDHINKMVHLYINGYLHSQSAVLTNQSKQINVVRMARSGAGAAYYSQKQGVMAIFNKFLSPSEVKQIFEANRRRFGL